MNAKIEQVEQSQPDVGGPDYWDSMLKLHGTGTDALLQDLVAIVNRTRMEMSVTLLVSGGLVTGRLIDGKTYYEKFAELYTGALERGIPGVEVKEIKAGFIAKGAIYDEVDDRTRPYQMVHLDNARFQSAAGFVPAEGMLWRGRINAVSGFSLGEFAVTNL